MKMAESLKRDDVIYLAGLFDGEGCVTYKKYWDSKRKNRPRKYFVSGKMEIVMTDRKTIQWCADKFGGKVSENLKRTQNAVQVEKRI